MLEFPNFEELKEMFAEMKKNFLSSEATATGVKVTRQNKLGHHLKKLRYKPQEIILDTHNCVKIHMTNDHGLDFM